MLLWESAFSVMAIVAAAGDDYGTGVDGFHHLALFSNEALAVAATSRDTLVPHIHLS